MKTFEVTIKAIVIKVLTVEAENEDEAKDKASDQFSASCSDDPEPEHYEEEVQSVKEVEPCK